LIKVGIFLSFWHNLLPLALAPQTRIRAMVGKSSPKARTKLQQKLL